MLAASKTNTERVMLQLAIGRVILFNSAHGAAEIDSAAIIAAKAINTSRQMHFDEGFINGLLLKAWCLHGKKEITTAQKTVKDALSYALKKNDSLAIAECYVVTADMYNNFAQDVVAYKTAYYDKASSIFRSKKAWMQLGVTLKRKGECLLMTGHKDEGIKILFEALNLYKLVGNKHLQRIYTLIARNSSECGDYINGIKYGLLAIKTSQIIGDNTLQLANTYNVIAFIYINTSDYNNALYYSLAGMAVAKRYKAKDHMLRLSLLLSVEYTFTHQLPKAMAVLQQAKSYAGNIYDEIFISTYYVRNLTDAGKLSDAVIYAKELEALLKTTSINNPVILRPAHTALAKFYIAAGQLCPATIYAEKLATSAYALHAPLGIMTAETFFYKIDSIRGDLNSGIKHYFIAQKIKDSTENVTKAYQMSLLQIENKTEENNSRIDTLTRQGQFKDEVLKRKQLIQKVIVSATIFLFIITMLIYSRYRIKQRSNVLLTQQKLEIDKKNAALEQLVDDKDGLLLEKDLLLKEVNHRVKNNLQIVMSLLQSQSGYMQNKQAQDAILESQNRVQSIALIHNQLFKTDKVAEIEMVSYIAELVHSLDYSINKGSNNVKMSFDIDAIMLDVSQAIPVGIILNEAVTNALKYAFPGERSGEIMIMLKEVADNIVMRIIDNGIGLPQNFELINADSLGMTLITGLASQLKGDFEIETAQGVTITVIFPVVTINSLRTNLA